MNAVRCYRYFFAFRPPPETARRIAAEARIRGIHIPPGELDRLHVTLCVVAELSSPDAFLAKRAHRAIGKSRLTSCKVSLGRLENGPNILILRSIGAQGEIRCFYRQLTELIRPYGFFPLHRKSGLNAHVTLAHRNIAELKDNIPVEWFPDELLLIESWDGIGRHVVIGRWPLLPQPQGEFDLCA